MWKRRQDPGKVSYDECSFPPASLVNGVHGHFVAAKCRQIVDPEIIAMHWWLQQISWREGGLELFAHSFLMDNDDHVARWDVDPSAFLDMPRRPDVQPMIRPGAFSEMIVSRLVDTDAPSLRADLEGFRDFWDCLVEWRAREIAEIKTRLVDTAISRTVFEELDFAEESRSFVLVEGREGIGKTEAARIWARRRPGRAVYIRLESGTDEASLYRSIAREIGTPCRYARSIFDMRARIQDALQPAQLMLVIDEAHFLWPQSQSVRVPRRIDWLRTALIDFGVPVALISTPQFFTNQCERFRNAGWNSNQIERRLARTVTLPDALSAEDALAVTRSYFPSVRSGQLLKRLSFAAMNTPGYLTTLDHMRKRVDFLAGRRAGLREGDVIELVLSELVMLPGAELPPARISKADPLQAPCRDLAQPLSGAGTASNRIGILNAQPSEVSTV